MRRSSKKLATRSMHYFLSHLLPLVWKLLYNHCKYSAQRKHTGILFKLSHLLPCLTYFFRLTLKFIWSLTFSSQAFIIVIKNMCVCVCVCFVSCSSLCGSSYTSTELIAKYTYMCISLLHISLPYQIFQ